MAQSRIRTLARLTMLLGLPIAVVLGLFGGGLYTGATHRHAVLSFEKEWLGMDVEVPPAPEKPKEDAAQAAGDGHEGEPDPKPTPAPASADAPEPAPTPAEPEPAPAPTPAAVDDPSGPDPAPGPGTDPTPEAVAPVAEGEPAGADLAARLALPTTVSVKVVVDPALVDAHPDWIDYAQRTLSEASLVYQKQFGITLELVGLVRWDVATDGLEPGKLREALEQVPREGAQVVLGLTGRSLPAGADEGNRVPAADSPFNLAHAVAFAPEGSGTHTRPALHALGHLFGAMDIDDPQHDAFRAGSWMSGATVAPGQDPWIDTDNRQRILVRKDRPFAAPEGGG